MTKIILSKAQHTDQAYGKLSYEAFSLLSIKYFRLSFYALLLTLTTISNAGGANNNEFGEIESSQEPNYLVEVEKLDSVVHDCEPGTSSCTEVNQWNFSVQLGLGIRTNPLNESNSIPLIVIPQWSYYGDYFFIENLDLGLNLFESENSQINLIGSPSYDSVFFNRWDPSNFLVDIGSLPQPGQPIAEGDPLEIDPSELSKRKLSYLGGLEWTRSFKNHLIQLNLLTELTNRHKGTEVRFAYGYSLNEYISTTLGFTWKDKKLTNYFYGISQKEVADGRAVYNAQASLTPFVRFSLRTKNNWLVSLEYQSLSNQISNSPIVSEDYVVTFFVGKRYDWY